MYRGIGLLSTLLLWAQSMYTSRENTIFCREQSTTFCSVVGKPTSTRGRRPPVSGKHSTVFPSASYSRLLIPSHAQTLPVVTTTTPPGDAASAARNNGNDFFHPSLVQDVVSGLEFLHEHGIVHCDVKAENILLQANGNGGYTPKLTDFGGAMGEEQN